MDKGPAIGMKLYRSNIHLNQNPTLKLCKGEPHPQILEHGLIDEYELGIIQTPRITHPILKRA